MFRVISADVAAVLATLLAAALILVQPWAGRRRYRRLVAAIDSAVPRARLRHYRRGIVGEWAAVGVLVVVGLLARRTPSSIGLDWGRHSVAEAALVAEVAAILGVSALVFRLGGPKVVDALRGQVRGFGALLPRGRRERTVFALLAVTAGICEELVVRGFGIAYLRWLWPGAPRVALILITAAVFGLGHLYQGVRGVVITGLVGAFFAWLVLSTGSLVPAMVVHALLDLRILALPDLAGDSAASSKPTISTPAATEPFPAGA